MQHDWSKKIQTGALILGAVLAGLIFVQSPGTSDVEIWRGWFNHALAGGVVYGYAANQADYPPLATTILYGASQFFDLFGRCIFSFTTDPGEKMVIDISSLSDLLIIRTQHGESKRIVKINIPD